jgi:3',5'-cyclic AMP phosphodiesterase CpdA
MRTLVHLSDLHFGRVDEALIQPLIAQVKQIKPDVVVVSGDLTQRVAPFSGCTAVATNYCAGQS